MQITQYITYFITRMYSNAQKKIKPKGKIQILNIAQKVQEEVEKRNQALQIINAYRKVQDIRVSNSKPNNQQKSNKETIRENRKPESEYANKIKQTLKQLNANRKKEMESIKHNEKTIAYEKPKSSTPAQRHLIQSGLRKLIKIVDKKYEENIKFSFQKIDKNGNETKNKIDLMIKIWKLKRVFTAWQYETMLIKIEKQKQQKDANEKQKMQSQLAEDFDYFCKIKRFFKAWNLEVRRAKKKRESQFEQNLKRQEEIKRIIQQGAQVQKAEKIQRVENREIKNKLKNFLTGLKQEIDGKQRLNTIKQHHQTEQIKQEQSQSERRQNQNQEQNRQQQEQEEVAVNHAPQSNQQNGQLAPLSNEALQKRRKQLQKKAKQRKQALDKLKREKEQKKKKEEQERQAIEKQIEEQVKKAKQQQYKKFLKERKEEEEWKIKQKEITKQAEQFDRLRTMKYYGWKSWEKLKKINLQHGRIMSELLSKIFEKRYLKRLVENICQKGEQKLKQNEKKVDKYYCSKLKRKYLLILRKYKNQQKQQKLQLSARHEFNILRIFFKQWQNCRNLIQLQNYEWQKPRIQRAQCLYASTLYQKVFQGLKRNRDEEIQNRNIQKHKAKIKQKVQNIVEQKPTINYDDFL